MKAFCKLLLVVAVLFLLSVPCQADTVVAVGDNWYGQCEVKAWEDIVQVSAGSEHTVGLKKDGLFSTPLALALGVFSASPTVSPCVSPMPFRGVFLLILDIFLCNATIFK